MEPGQTPDMSAILQQAQAMQEQLMSAQAELAETEVTGQAGNGLVTQTAAGELRALRIDPSIVDPSDIETLQDLVLGALGNAAANAAALQAEKMGPLAGGFDLGGGGFDLDGGPGPGLPRA